MKDISVEKVDQSKDVEFLVDQLLKLASKHETYSKGEAKDEILHAMQLINKSLETILGTPYLVKVGESKWNSKK